MAIPNGTEFEIQSITSYEFKVIGGTDKLWTFHGRPGGLAFQANDEWQRSYRPKIGGYLVGVHDPANPQRGWWYEYYSPTKHAGLLRKQQRKTQRKQLTNKPFNR